MSEAFSRQVPNRFGAMVLNGGGLSVREALSRADAALDGMRDDLLGDLDGLLEQLEAGFGAQVPDRVVQDPHDLYRLSYRIIDIGSSLPGSKIDRAAFSLCDLAERCKSEGAWDWPAVDVHLSALRLLRQEGQAMADVQRTALLSGLASLAAPRRKKPPRMGAVML